MSDDDTVLGMNKDEFSEKMQPIELEIMAVLDKHQLHSAESITALATCITCAIMHGADDNHVMAVQISESIAANIKKMVLTSIRGDLKRKVN